jgi:hypothetical protein
VSSGTGGNGCKRSDMDGLRMRKPLNAAIGPNAADFANSIRPFVIRAIHNETISASSRSCTTSAAVAKPCSVPLSPPWWHDGHHPGTRKERLEYEGS